MHLAFLIPTRDRHAALATTLPAVVRAAKPVGAAILVCDQSARAYAGAGPWRVLHRPGLGGLPAARNLLLRAAGGAEVVCFLDDDVTLGADFGRRLLAHAHGETDGDGWGPVVETRPPWLRRAHRLLQPGALRDPRRLLGRRVDAPTTALFGCCFAVRTAVARAHGFDERLGGYALGEDLDFCHRLVRSGHKLCFRRDLRCIHRCDPANRADAADQSRHAALLLRRLLRDQAPAEIAAPVHLALGLAAMLAGSRRLAALKGVIAGLCDPDPLGRRRPGSLVTSRRSRCAPRS